MLSLRKKYGGGRLREEGILHYIARWMGTGVSLKTFCADLLTQEHEDRVRVNAHDRNGRTPLDIALDTLFVARGKEPPEGSTSQVVSKAFDWVDALEICELLVQAGGECHMLHSEVMAPSYFASQTFNWGIDVSPASWFISAEDMTPYERQHLRGSRPGPREIWVRRFRVPDDFLARLHSVFLPAPVCQQCRSLGIERSGAPTFGHRLGSFGQRFGQHFRPRPCRRVDCEDVSGWVVPR